MLPHRDSRLTRISLAVFFALLAAYGIFEARGLIAGPSIELPAAIIETRDRYLTIAGTALRISALQMNGREISVTEDGRFEEPYLAPPGVSRVAFAAYDNYGRIRERTLQIVYTGTSTRAAESPLLAAASGTTTFFALPQQTAGTGTPTSTSME